MIKRILKGVEMRGKTALRSRKVLGSTVAGLRFALTAKQRPEQLWRARAGNQDFVMRWGDWPAVEEVLIGEEYKIIEECLKGRDSPLVLDLGANIGTFSLYVLARHPRARVMAYEASAATFAVLKATHGFSRATGWKVTQAAVWSNDGTVSFDSTAYSIGGRVVANGRETVPAIGFGTLMKQLADERVDLLKIDIEGAEEAVLAGREAELARVDHLIVELHPGRCDTAKVEATLRKAYTHIYQIPGRTSIKPLLLCARRPFDLPVYEPA